MVEQDQRLQILISLIKRIKNSTVVVFSDVQKEVSIKLDKFLFELFPHIGINNTKIVTQSSDLSKVELPIFYDPSLTELNNIKKGILFIMPEETKPQLKEINLDKTKQAQFVTDDVLKLISRNYVLYCLAEKAYKDFVNIYQNQLNKDQYDVTKLNPNRLCKSFGFDVTPRLNSLKLRNSKEYVEKQKKQTQNIKRKIIRKTNKKQ